MFKISKQALLSTQKLTLPLKADVDKSILIILGDRELEKQKINEYSENFCFEGKFLFVCIKYILTASHQI